MDIAALTARAGVTTGRAMTSRLRTFGVRVAFLFALVAAALAIRITAGKPTLPVALLQSFDRACSLVEKQIAELEAPPAATPATTKLATALDRFARAVVGAEELATVRLDAELAHAHALSDEHRFAVAGCIELHLDRTRADVARASDPDERAEYATTIARLLDLRGRV